MKDKVPTQEQLDKTEYGNYDSDKKILKMKELNEIAYTHIVLSWNHLSIQAKWTSP